MRESSRVPIVFEPPMSTQRSHAFVSGKMSTDESWWVNRHITQCTSPVFVILLVISWRLRQRRHVGPCGLRKLLYFLLNKRVQGVVQLASSSSESACDWLKWLTQPGGIDFISSIAYSSNESLTVQLSYKREHCLAMAQTRLWEDHWSWNTLRQAQMAIVKADREIWKTAVIHTVVLGEKAL